MHHSHTARPQQIRHHIHQQAMHAQRPPPIGMNVSHQIRPPQQQHHISNVPPPGGHQQMSPYIPPHQRETNRLGHHHQRINTQIQQHQVQSKFRAGNNRSMGLTNSSLNQSQQTGSQQQHLTPQTHITQQTHVQPTQSHVSQQPQTHVSQQTLASQQQSATDLKSQTVTTKQTISSQQSAQSQQTVPPPPPQITTQVKTQIVPPQQTAGSQQVLQPQQVITTTQQVVSNQQITPNQQQPLQSQTNVQQAPLSAKHPISNKPMVMKPAIHPSQHQLQTQHHIRPPPSQALVYMQSSNKSFKSPQLQRFPHPHQSLPNRVHNPLPPRPPSLPKQIQPSAPAHSINLHQQHKPVHNISNSSGSVNVINTSVNLAQSEQTQSTLQSISNVDSRATKIIESQSKTPIIQQNSNLSVSTTQQEGKPELACGNSHDTSTNETLANTKEKTPMCLVNELARFNKIQHQYRLTGEQGPAHCKRFTVTLKLGDEEYTAEGPSIKKAQHSAAAEAISKTNYQHPPAKTVRMKNGRTGIGNITPTVELNALAMKLGEPTVYVFDTPPPHGVIANNVLAPPGTSSHQILGPGSSQQQGNFSMSVQSHGYIQEGHYSNYGRNNPNNMYVPPRFQGIPRRPFGRGFIKCNSHRFPAPLNGVHSMSKEPCKITLIVGKHKFVGVGATVQMAKHDAAARALDVLKPLAESEAANESQNVNVDDPNADLKSPISLVHETALKRNLVVSFEVKSERGPPHMKTFVTVCKVGNLVTEGEGNGKKISKKRSAEKMLEELKKLPPLSPSKSSPNGAKIKALKRKPQIIKKKARNLIKEKSEPEIPEEINPISKLIQIQQALKEREPVYTLVEEKGAPRRREFVIEVSAGGHVARGTGSNKKMAKKIAAKNLLALMGYESPSTNKENNSKIVNVPECSENKTKHSAYTENGESHVSVNQGGSTGRQIVPGLLLMQQKKKVPFNQTIKSDGTPTSESPKRDEINSSRTKTSEKSSSIAPNISSDGFRPKDQLLYLAQLLGFQAAFSDYPKGNHGEYLTIVTLSTDPPQICHGAGCDTEASQDKASITALQMLSELGLDNVKPLKSQEEKKVEPVLSENSKE